ncbi:roadblock/LC7 domain-containing protein [Calothrix sp. UHCC 0171]|uniref:roadblock/LC7 domain-containing protein n=1 Tax=Calothrix sp. UHCC 0171 TaxID=3110245 RepID=UPI002B209838|nr:roadblock/LC7 domain-containing protein [Calothrix sp. UHCC 0171]MEA5570362.1 roadblock/LC7 domain-containing protein [Calothrix sp. UHCC 0171]
MPLGKIIKLIKGGFKKQPSKSGNIPELSEAQASATSMPMSTELDETTSATVTENFSYLISSATASSTNEPLATISAIVSEGRNMINISMLQEELQNFVSGASEVQGAALVSPDGLALASVLPGGMDEERTAAMSASMLSLGERIGHELVRGVVERIVVEGEKGYGVLVNCGSDAVLLVLAGSVVKQGILFLEIKRAVAKLTPLLG